jgi:hypothetical protein
MKSPSSRTRLNKPRVYFYDPSLVMAAEAAKFRQRDFSDCHWCTLLLHAYRASAYNKEEYEKSKAAGTVNRFAMRHGSALEMVIRAYVNGGPRSAKKLAKRLEAEGEHFPPWMKLETSEDWRTQLKGPPPRFLFNQDGFINGTRELDGD